MTTRLCFAVGPWQLVLLAAALRQDAEDRGKGEPARTKLVIYEPESVPGLRDSMMALAPYVREWDEIASDSDTLAINLPKDQWPFPVDDYASRIRAAVGEKDADEIWLSHLHTLSDRLILEAYPDSRVVLYEDGTASYKPHPVGTWGMKDLLAFARVAPGLLLRRKVDLHLSSLRLSNWRLSPRHLRRVSKEYLCLLDVFPEPVNWRGSHVCGVRKDVLTSVFSSALEMPELKAALATLPAIGDQDVLFLGPLCYPTEPISREAKLEILKRVVRELLAKGYRVWWKEHPREARPLYDDVAAGLETGALRRFNWPSAFPVELAMGDASFGCCVAASSSTLFYLPGLTGTPVFTYAGAILDALVPPESVWALEVARQMVPSYDVIPAWTGRESRQKAGTRLGT